MDCNLNLFSTGKPGFLFRLVRSTILLATIVSATVPVESQDEPVVATVNGKPITAGQVERDLTRTLGEIKLDPRQREKAKSVALEKRINQQVILDFLQNHNLGASENEVRLKIEALKRELATVEKTIDDYLEQTTQTLNDLEFNIAWQLGWKRYLDQMLTEELLESHFNENHRQFDGTELRVAHLLLKSSPSVDDPSESLELDLQKKAARIKSQLDSGERTWDQAVAQFSDAPTKDAGGEIGWIKLTGPMPDSFSRAAFRLAAGEVSDPVQTKFGCHLIRCVEVKPGKLGWRDRVDLVKKSATLELFDAVVAQHRPNLKVEYSVKPAN